MIDPQQFWEEKILLWEADRYGQGSARSSWLERLASKLSGSLRARLALAQEVLRPHVAGRRIVELGCGTGLLAEPLVEAGAASYLGIDIARSAVATARERTGTSPVASRIAFEQGNVASLPPLAADIVFSLGLFDWLTPAEIDAVFAAGREADYLHAIAERRFSPSRYLHRAYVYASYGHRTGAYVPRYFDVAELRAAAARHNPRPMRVIRSPRLSFGAFVTTLPSPPA
jgi:SAM-dependent methyltransferase